MLGSSRSSSAARLSRSAATALNWSPAGSPASNQLCTLAASFHSLVAVNGYGFSSTKAPKPFFESCLSHIAHRSALARSYSVSAATTVQDKKADRANDGFIESCHESQNLMIAIQDLQSSLRIIIGCPTDSGTIYDMISNSEFTEMTWDGAVGAVDAARESKHSCRNRASNESTLKQKDGLDSFISQQPKVMGDSSRPIMDSR